MKRFLPIVSVVFALSLPANASSDKIFSYRSFWPEFNAMADFKKAGVNAVAILPSNSDNSLGEPYGKYPAVWAWHDTYDWESLDRQFDGVLKANPDAEIICIVDLNSPRWFARHLAMVSRSMGMEADSFTQLSNCLTNPLWVNPTKKFAAEFFNRVEKKYGKHIKGYLIACGQTDEWMDYSSGIASANKSDAWRKWLAKKGYPQTPVPGIDRLEKASFEGRLRDPAKEGDVIRYAEFTSDIVSDAIIDFAKFTRERVSKDRLIGSFYGYVMELAGKRFVWCGHLAYEKVFNSPHLDFFASPAAYGNRAPGEGSGFMCAYETLRRLDKNWLHEIDLRTHTYNSKLSKYISISTSGALAMTKNQTETSAVLKREFCLATIKGTSLWCFDMWGGVFATSETLEIVKRARQIWGEYAGKNLRQNSEIAIVVDPRSALYISASISHEPYNMLRKRLNLISAPFDVISFGDIPHIDISKYKTLIIPALFELTDSSRKILEKYAFCGGRTVLFAYAPAISDGKTLDTARIKKLTGFEYGAKGINKKRMDGWNCIYIHDYNDITTDVLKSVARDSGVHIYLDENVPVYSNEKLTAVHAGGMGCESGNGAPESASITQKLKIKLPQKFSKITELFSNRVVAENAEEFEYELSIPDTALFLTEK